MVQNIPNILTVCNLLCGCLGITMAFSNNLEWAAYWICIAALFDFLDGFTARLLNVTSEIGKELDSLVDMSTFGIAPGLIMYEMIKYPSTNNSSLEAYAHLLIVAHFACFIAFLIPIFSAFRLAKFNISQSQLKHFIGLPTPASALLIVFIPLLAKHSYFMPYQTYILNPYTLSALTVVICYLMVSRLSMFSLKFSHYSWKGNQMRYIFLILSLALIGMLSFASVTIIIILYIILSIINKPTKKDEIPCTN